MITTGTDLPELLTTADVADRLRLSEATVKRLIATGELASLKAGRARRIPLAAVRAYVDGLIRAANGLAPVA